MPETLRDQLRVGILLEELVQSVKHPESCSMPNLVDRGTSLSQEPGDVPARVTHCIIERSSD
jgi:hypothetical protein